MKQYMAKQQGKVNLTKKLYLKKVKLNKKPVKKGEV